MAVCTEGARLVHQVHHEQRGAPPSCGIAPLAQTVERPKNSLDDHATTVKKSPFATIELRWAATAKP
jgi:hypothetical protein